MSKVFETEVAGRKLSIEVGKVAELANGSVIVRYGDTVVITAGVPLKQTGTTNLLKVQVVQ